MKFPTLAQLFSALSLIIAFAALAISFLSYQHANDVQTETRLLRAAEKATRIKLVLLEEKANLDEGMRRMAALCVFRPKLTAHSD